MQRAAADIAIVTVSGPADEAYIRLNISAIRNRNPDLSFPIHVIDNGKYAQAPNAITSTLDAILHDGVAQNMQLPAHYRASYHHADALNYFFKTQRIDARYVLIMDPDFYVLREHWIAAMLSHMHRENLAFFGAPWHPRWYSKYRYFPCVHFMCIDTQQVALSTLDFSPTLPQHNQRSLGIPTIIRKLFGIFYFMTLQRLIIGQANDTGTPIFKRFYNVKKAGLLQPVMSPTINFVQAKLLQLPLMRWLESQLPDAWSYLPQKHDYYSNCGFKTCGLPDLSALQWEEFMWQGMPFAFHLRRFLKKERHMQEELAQIKTLLE